MAGRQGPSDELADVSQDPSLGHNGLRLLFESFSKNDPKSRPGGSLGGPIQPTPMGQMNYQPIHAGTPKSDPYRGAPIGRGPPANAIPLASAAPQKIWILEQDLIRQAAVSQVGGRGTNSPHSVSTPPVGSRPMPFTQQPSGPPGHPMPQHSQYDQSPSGSPSFESVLQRLFSNVKTPENDLLRELGRRQLETSDYVMDVNEIESALARQNPSLPRFIPNRAEPNSPFLDTADGYRRHNDMIEAPVGFLPDKPIQNQGESAVKSMPMALRQILGPVVDVSELEEVLASLQSAPVRPPPGFEKYSASPPESSSWLRQRGSGVGFSPKSIAGPLQDGISLLSQFQNVSQIEQKSHLKDLSGGNSTGNFLQAKKSPVVGAHRESSQNSRASKPETSENYPIGPKKGFWDNFPDSAGKSHKRMNTRDAVRETSSKMESLAVRDQPNTKPREKGDEDKEKKKERKRSKKRIKKSSEKTDNVEVQASAPIVAEDVASSSNQHARSGTKTPRVRTRKGKDGDQHFEAYLDIDTVLAGLQNKTLLKGDIRINARNYKGCYINDPNEGKDILISGTVDRNRAMEGDVVVVQLKSENQWVKNAQKSSVQVTGKVVYILEKVHSRICIGKLTKIMDNDYATFSPRDSRIPRLRIPSTSLSVKIVQNPTAYENILFKAKIIDWDTPNYAIGVIEETLGKKGDVEVETQAILRELSLDGNAVPESLNKYLPSFTITQEEIDKRLDLRKECIFTIDPSTARDLDDAVSIRKLKDDLYEVGVHISDVSYFLQLGTPLDEFVSKRATTIYLVDKAIHMLPLELCLQCSLLPGQDKYALSVIWQMDSEGKIKETKFARTVIHSCAKLSYDHAQAVIDGQEVEFPTLYNDIAQETICESIRALHKISQNMTKRRFANGALRIDQPKVSFKVNENLVPTETWLYELKESNRLIEEFMLRANESVAEFIHGAHPRIALLRRHSPPKADMMSRLLQSFETIGIKLNSANAGDVHRCIRETAGDNREMACVLSHFCAKPMMRAEYFCFEPESHHYALNIDMYTHFTSPIRRYVDIIVHRVLCATLGYDSLPKWDTLDVRQFCRTSNTKKQAAKRAGEMSSELFTALYIREKGGLTMEAIVHNVISHAMDILVLPLALNTRVYLDRLPAKLDFVESKSKMEGVESPLDSELTVRWNHAQNLPITYRVFSKALVHLTTQENGHLRIECQLQPPVPLPASATV